MKLKTARRLCLRSRNKVVKHNLGIQKLDPAFMKRYMKAVEVIKNAEAINVFATER